MDAMSSSVVRGLESCDMRYRMLSAVMPPASPQEIARTAKDNGHVPTFLTALCELLMCADPSPLSLERDEEVKDVATIMARKMGFSDWIEAYHGLVI